MILPPHPKFSTHSFDTFSEHIVAPSTGEDNYRFHNGWELDELEDIVKRQINNDCLASGIPHRSKIKFVYSIFNKMPLPMTAVMPKAYFFKIINFNDENIYFIESQKFNKSHFYAYLNSSADFKPLTERFLVEEEKLMLQKTVPSSHSSIPATKI